ncbi:hypothetical protein GDO78_009407 [Eleutherodactylus coqui]|uniref:Uncharacterized protein n=1 Tax=Eleutherodactylus coqui TaxID=57060 RepID=A0A8J6F7T7_ELECQ|nr:hypothetical protein GDO78_009407 [Eleutherodactylus coqui]
MPISTYWSHAKSIFMSETKWAPGCAGQGRVQCSMVLANYGNKYASPLAIISKDTEGDTQLSQNPNLQYRSKNRMNILLSFYTHL